TSDGKAKANASAQAKVATSNASQVKTITDSDYETLEKSVTTDFANSSVSDGSGLAGRAVVVVNDSTTLEAPEKQPLYTKIDAGMKLLFNSGLRPAYGKVVFLGRGEPDGE